MTDQIGRTRKTEMDVSKIEEAVTTQLPSQDSLNIGGDKLNCLSAEGTEP